ncbi:MAG TPA: response regulator [Burkholderiales bacterium]|jgi:DNA-binding response OmpR family regulator|nr:response regulator [Burkholderiales bacterium]
MSSRILIVDDEPAIVLSIEFLLQNEGYETAVARNGSEALQHAASFRPQLVVLDVMLPEIDGFEVCRQLRADPAQAGVKILLLSARGRAAEIERGVRLGADAYITKPFATRDLVASIRDLLG